MKTALPRIAVCLLFPVMLHGLAPAAFGVVFRETFDVAAAGEAAFESAYPALDFTDSGASGTVETLGGRLRLDNTTGANITQRAVVDAAETSGITRFWSLVGAGNSNGNYNVGLNIDGNNIVFHPGFGGGALRVEGPGGFGNNNVGFTPANGSLHLLKVDVDRGTGTFDIRLVDADDPSNVFTTSFTNPAAVNSPIAIRRSGPGSGAGTQTGIYDGLTAFGGNTKFFEAFDLDVAGVSQFANAYPDFNQMLDGGDLSVVNGVVEMGAEPGTDEFQFATIAGVAAPIEISLDVGADNSNGSYNVGLSVGDNNLVFHPGFNGGAFRVEGPGGFGNTNMGFTPANGQLHHLDVRVSPSGLFNITLTDGGNPDNIFTASFSNPGALGGAIGFKRSGPAVGVALFDNLRVEAVVPEPTTLVLVIGGLAAGMSRRRRASGQGHPVLQE